MEEAPASAPGSPERKSRTHTHLKPLPDEDRKRSVLVGRRSAALLCCA